MNWQRGVVPKSSLGKGDLLRMLADGVDPLFAATLLDYELPRADETKPRQPAATAQQAPAAPPASPKPVTAELPEQEERAPELPLLLRVIGPVVKPPSEEGAEMPRFLRQGTPCRGSDLARRGGSGPSFVPLSPAARLAPTLRSLLRVRAESRELDARRLVEQLARGCLSRRLPHRRHAIWPARLQIILDQSAPMVPFRQDQFQVARWLRIWLPLRSIEELAVDDAGCIRTYVRTTRRAGALARRVSNRRPDASTTLLALSDLGGLDREAARLAVWRRLQSQAERAGSRACALVIRDELHPARDATARWICRLWAGRFRPVAATDNPPEAPDALDEVLLLLSPAAWVDFPLLRAMRQHVRAQGAGASLEARAWLDSRVGFRSDERGFMLRAEVLLELRAKFRELPESRRTEVAGLLERLHGHLGVVPRAEELFALGDERAAAQARALTASYACLLRERARAIDDSVESAFAARFETLLPKDQWLHDEPRALWALHHAAGERFDQNPPEGLDLESIRWALERLPEPTVCSVWQRGAELDLVLAADAAPSPISETGCRLCELPLRFPTVTLIQRSGDDPIQQASLTLEARGEGHLRAPASSAESLVLETHLARSELRLEPKPAWASAFYRDEQGLWIETTVVGYRLEPVASPSKPRLRIEDLFSHGPRPEAAPTGQMAQRRVRTLLTYPTWATCLDQDEHGLFAEFVLAPGVVMRLRWVPPGSFLMGSPKDERGRYDDEGPEHRVELTRGYWLADTPCTQAEWQAVMGNNPSHFSEDANCPVEQVSWEDCQVFCEKLRARFPGLEARLPSEAEWEYACRAGKRSAYNDGSGCTEPDGADPALLKLGWFAANSGGRTQAVHVLLPNAWGLYDMHGNVLEWCQDYWQDNYRGAEEVDPKGPGNGSGRVIRGGSWGSQARYCRSAYRFWRLPSDRLGVLGFRLAADQVSQGVRAEREEESGASGRPRSDEGRGAQAADGERSVGVRRRRSPS